MKRAILLTLLSSLPLGCSSPPPPPPPLEEDLFERITVDVAGHDVAQVVALIGTQVGVRIRADPSVNEAGWLAMIDAPWPQVLETLAAQVRCVVTKQPDESLLVAYASDVGPRDARQTLKAIAAWEKVDIHFHARFDGEVRSDLRDLDLDDAVQQVLDDVGGYEWVKEDRDHWRIVPAR